MTDFVLETDRLVLRPAADTDTEGLHALFTEPDIRRFLWDDEVIPRSQTAEMVRKSRRRFASDGYGLWLMMVSDAPDHPVGFAGLWHFRDPPELELVFGVARDWWGKGFAEESARAVMRYAFGELGFARIDASTDTPNIASLHVLQKLGMRRTRRETVGGLDTVFFTIDAREFAER